MEGEVMSHGGEVMSHGGGGDVTWRGRENRINGSRLIMIGLRVPSRSHPASIQRL